MGAATAARKPATKRTASAKTATRRSASAKPATQRGHRNAKALERARNGHAATATTRTAPATPRRKSGPVRQPMPKRTVAPARPAIARVAQGGATLFLDGILRGRAWVALVGALLAGIVFLNVSVLELNRGIAENSAKTDKLEIRNSKLRGRVAKLDSAERIQQLAEARGFVLPLPGDVTYLKPRTARDAKLAATRITAPDEDTATTAVDATTTPEATTTAPTDTTVAPVATTPTPEPAPVADPATVTPAATPVATTTASPTAPTTTP
jgi:hypothetical protein